MKAYWKSYKLIHLCKLAISFPNTNCHLKSKTIKRKLKKKDKASRYFDLGVKYHYNYIILKLYL